MGLSAHAAARQVTVVFLFTLSMTACSPVPKFDPDRDARTSFEAATSQASAEARYLMVVFGADWCPDCRKLYENLHSDAVASYMRDHMDFVTIDVGQKDRNLALAAELGVTVANGIPVAVFFGPDGKQLGTTNDGQLEPSRHFTSRQILTFVRTVVEHHRITAPLVEKTSG